MKKLMIAAAIVCAAVVSQAATVNWSTPSSIKGIADATIAAGLTDGQSYNADGKVVGTTGYAAYCTGTLAYTLTLTYDLGSGSTTETVTGTLAKGAGITSGKIASTVTADLFDNKGTAYTYTLVLTDTGVDGKDKAFTQTATINGNGTVQPNGTISLSTLAPSTWVVSMDSPTPPEPTPEPTSGMLLLLGVAGLSLRRKQK